MKKQYSPIVPVALVLGIASFASRPVLAQSEETTPPTSTPVAAEAPQTAIAVKVNGEQIPFATQGPIQRGTAILVPLRGVFEKLGATVTFDAAAKTITAVKAATTVILTIGDVNSTINGVGKVLTSAPEVIEGTTFVPLRFVSEALGAQVKWDASTRVVDVTTDAIVAEQLPTLPLRAKVVDGTITGVFPEADAITLRVRSGENRRVPLAPGAVVQVKAAKKVIRQASINSLRVGDQVLINRDAMGQITVIEFSVDERRGIIKAKEPLANGNILIRLTNGTSVEVLGSAPVERSGLSVSLSDIKISEGVVIRVNPETGIGIGVAGITADNTNPVPPEPTAPPTSPKANTDTSIPSTRIAAAPTKVVVTNPVPPASNPTATAPEPAKPVAAPTKVAPPPTETKAAEVKTDQKPEIKSVTHSAAGKTLKGGETVTVTVVGTPKGEVSLSVPKLFNDTLLPLMEKEDAPGTYVGTFTTPFNVTALDVALSAILKQGEQTAPVVQAEKVINIDGAGPEVNNVLPKEGTNVPEVRPRISGEYKDIGTKVDPKTARLYVNDQEVTDKAEFTDSGFAFAPAADLKEGTVKVAIAVRDTQGNESSRTWMFTVKMPTKPIQRVSVAPTGNALRAGEILTVRLEGVAGGKAAFRIETMEEMPMTEESAGVYVGRYSVKRGDAVKNARVLVSLLPPGSEEKILREAPETITLRAAPPAAPVVNSPKNNDTVKGPVTFSGTADPFSTVRLTFAFEGKQFLSKAKGTVPAVEVKADESGNWKTDALALELPRGIGNVTFTVDVIVIAVTEEVSPATTIKFKKK